MSSILCLAQTQSIDDDGRSKDLEALRKAYNGNLTESQLVPKGFQLSKKVKGDLNNDRIPDVALILHRELSTKNEQENSYDLPQFVIVFEGVSNGLFKLWLLGEHHFTNSLGNQMSENGIANLSIEKNVLTIASDFAMSMGGWSAGGCIQKWRKNKLGLELIGLTVNSTDRKCGECGTYKDINFSTHKQILKKISDDPENPKTTVRKDHITEGPIAWENFDYEKRCYGN